MTPKHVTTLKKNSSHAGKKSSKKNKAPNDNLNNEISKGNIPQVNLCYQKKLINNDK